MYKITRELIKIRKPYNEFIEHVNVKKLVAENQGAAMKMPVD